MKRIMFAALATLAFGGCSLTSVKTPEWEAHVRSHWFKRDVDKLDIQRSADGSYSVSLNGYKSDASEQFPAFTREMWGGLAILGRIAAATVNPTAAAIPLTTEPADAEAVAKLQRELATAKAEVLRAKAAVAAIAPIPATNATTCAECETK
jgi:hypothetical protein